MLDLTCFSNYHLQGSPLDEEFSSHVKHLEVYLEHH